MDELSYFVFVSLSLPLPIMEASGRMELCSSLLVLSSLPTAPLPHLSPCSPSTWCKTKSTLQCRLSAVSPSIIQMLSFGEKQARTSKWPVRQPGPASPRNPITATVCFHSSPPGWQRFSPLPPDSAVIRNSSPRHVALPGAPGWMRRTHVAARPPAGKRIEDSFAEHGRGDGQGDEPLHSKQPPHLPQSSK